MDFSQLSTSARRELASVLSDEFCYCGCPHSLGACLKEHPGCKHARRMAVLAAMEAAAGTPGVEIILMLSKYYLAFREPRAALKVDERMCMGPADAKITIAEFSDFECPFCAAARPILEGFATDNASRVRLCYLPYPLSNHPNAIPAGQAALFARDQGKFWPMHDALFENQMMLDNASIKQLAAKIGLDANELGKVMGSRKYVDELNAFKEAGRAAGVDSTPAIYVNGRRFALPLTRETLAHTVDDEVEWAGNGNAWAKDP